MSEPIGIIGGGAWGVALAVLAARSGGRVVQWMRDPESVAALNERRTNRYLEGISLPASIVATSDLARPARECRLLIVVVPSQGMREVVARLGDHLDGGHMLVHGVKGLEAGSLKRMSQILKEETCCKKIGVISGPNLAREVALGQPSAAVVASTFEEVVAHTRDALVGNTFRVYGSRDLVGTELGGALKNIYAIAAGMVSGLDFGDNTKAMLLTRAIAEMSRFGARFGAKPETFSGLSGIGDLMATCFSPLSRNFQVGRRLAQGEPIDRIESGLHQVAEGVRTSRTIGEYAREHRLYMPIAEGVYRILYEAKSPSAVLADLMDASRHRHEAGAEIS